jgi:hypothetical protein
MSQDFEPNGPPSDAEPEGRIAELASLEQDISPNFLVAVRKKIYRRTAVAQAAAFSWNVPKIIFFELLELVGHFINPSAQTQRRKRGSR